MIFLCYSLPILQEPVQDEDDIIKYCEKSGLPVALDETIDKFQENPLKKLEKYANPGIVAVVSEKIFNNLISGLLIIVSLVSLFLEQY